MDTASTAETLQGGPAEGSYEAYVLRLVPHWPHLRIVTDFMSSNRKDTPTLTPFTKITLKTDIRVIGMVRSYNHQEGRYLETVENNHFLSVDQLRPFLDLPRASLYRRLIMVEDLSADVVEFLGSTYDIDPEFFAQHLGEWWTDYKGFLSSEDAGSSLQPLGSSSRTLSFQHFKFRRAYDWEGAEGMKNTRLGGSDLWQPYISQGIKPEVFVDEGFSAFSLCHQANNRWTGVYLFDRLLDMRAPQLHAGIRNFRKRPAFTVSDGTQLPLSSSAHQLVQQGRVEWHYKSLRDETAEGILNMPAHDLLYLSNLSYPNLELDLPLRVLFSSWVLVANILNRKMCGLEDRIASNIWGDALSNADILIQLVKLRKHAIEFSGSLERTLFTLKTNLANLRSSSALQEDALQLISEFTKIAARGDANSPTFLAKSAVEEAQKTCAQVEMMKRLTMLAFVFVPMTSIATVLSIQDSWPWTKYSIFAGLSVPVLVLTLFLSKDFKGLRSYQRSEEKKLPAPPVTPSNERQAMGSYTMPGGYT